MITTLILIEMLGLGIAAWMDMKYMKVPIWFFPSLYAVEIICMVLNGDGINGEFLSTAAILFIILFTGSLVSRFGGADALASVGFGLTLGYYGIFAIMLSFVFSVPFLIKKKNENDDLPYPFIPFMFFGYMAIALWVL